MSPLSATTATAPATARPAGRIPPPPTRKPRGNPSLHLAPAQPARGRPCPRALVPGVEPRGARPAPAAAARPPPSAASCAAACTAAAPPARARPRACPGGAGASPASAPPAPSTATAAQEARAGNRYRITLLCRTRVTVAAKRYQDFLPAAFLARLHDYAPELTAPRFPTAGITAAQDQMRRRAVAAALAPWRWAIADNRKAARAARKQAAAARAADPNAASVRLRGAPGRAARRRRASSPPFWQNSLYQSAPPPRPTPA